MIRRNRFGVMALICSLGLTGCLSMQNQSSIDGNADEPVVEAFIEYPGPQSKWGGPESFLIHVNAKEAGPVHVSVTPELPAVNSQDHQTAPRQPASHGGKAMTSDEARQILAAFTEAVKGEGAPFRGCLYPVRVRLVKASGALAERQGCRSEQGWTRAVSETAQRFLAAAH